MTGPVVVRTDGEMCCDAALRFAAHEAAARSSELILVLSNRTRPDPDDGDRVGEVMLRPLDSEPTAIRALVRALGTPREALPRCRVAADGHGRFDLVIRTSTGSGAELIVMAQQTSLAHDRLLHRPSPADLARRTGIPVVVVPARDHARTAEGGEQARTDRDFPAAESRQRDPLERSPAPRASSATPMAKSAGSPVLPSPLEHGGAVILARHGRTELNARGLLRGHLDPPLDEVGVAEAAALGKSLADFLGAVPVLLIASSPLRRAMQTAAAVAAALPAPAPVVHPVSGLVDRDYGRWAGHSLAEVTANCGSIDHADGVETTSLVTARARAVLEEQRPLLSSGTVVLVAHDAVNRLLLASLDSGLGPADGIAQATACWNLLGFREGRWQVDRVNQGPPD